MKNYFLPMLLSLFFLGACDKNDEIIPEDVWAGYSDVQKSIAGVAP
ncbi:hypothetical protein [Alistipes putredinis]